MRAFCSHHDRPRLDVVDARGSIVGDICEPCSALVVLPLEHHVQRRLFQRVEHDVVVAPKPPVLNIELDPRALKIEPLRTEFVPPVDPRAAADPSTPVHYVVGFMFDRAFSRVVLVTKEKPVWQRGRLNGPGGKIEAGESPTTAMAREFEEETGVVAQDGWRRFCVGTVFNGVGLTAIVHYFRAVEAPPVLDRCRTTTAEKIGVYDVGELIGYTRSCPIRMMVNLHWLLPMAMTMEANTADFFEVIERNV